MSEPFDLDPNVISSGLFAPGRKFPYLLILEGPRRGAYFPLNKLPITLGRKDADIMPDPTDHGLSRLHATFEVDDENIILTDNESTNGTVVNEQPITRVVLRDGDKIIVGNSTLKFLSPSASNVQMQSRALDQERRDKLTGAYTNAYLKEKYTEAFAEAGLFHVSYGIMLLEVDRFGDIRGQFGLKVSNSVLIDLAEFISSLLLEDQELFRIGGAKFGVLLIGPSAKFVRDMGEMVRQSTESSEFSHKGVAIPLTLSVGVAYHESDGPLPKNPDEIYDRADQCLMKVRDQGGNKVQG